jgi:hypothetical protein
LIPQFGTRLPTVRLIDGIERVLQFFRVSSRTDSLTVIQERFQAALGVSMDAAEIEWTAMLRSQGVPRFSLF